VQQSSPAVFPTTLVPLLYQRTGGRDEIVYAPTCATCGKPVLDLSAANVCAEKDAWGGWGTGEALYNESGLKISRIGTVNALVYHKGDCDTGGKPWTDAKYVFKYDQRHHFEKEGRL
jgi:hypothetical protein